jgi:GT2 family glycosyltransferase
LVDPILSARPGREGIAVSVVSHGQRALAEALLHRLAALRDPLVAQAIVTHNLQDAPIAAPAGGWPFEFTEIFNEAPAGFAVNHDRAFAHCARPFFCVLNPDVELVDPGVWRSLADVASRPGVGCAYPRLLNGDGTPQDQEREAVTPLALLRRHVLGRPQSRADWVSGAFWLVPSEAWRAVGGLDERFRMYCEDTDFCLRLQLAGYRLERADAVARHGAERASRKPGLRMWWHAMSLLRLWTHPPLWRFMRVAKARQ